jgi:pimeloyl-ACP methyl ester carboxylesterase
VGAAVPTNLDELWADFAELDRTTPLETEVLQEWTEGEIVCRVVRFQAGVFKGAPARVAAFYGFPRGGTRLPALLDLHGGGQSANLDHVVLDAKRGYASLSLNWGGNPLNFGRSRQHYEGPQTDWGKLDATHPPQRNPVNHFVDALSPDAFTLDDVPSPRNSNWYIVLMAARRAITFLRQQPEVDSSAIGVYGHSMGGKLTTDLCGIEHRIRAAVPSCGGAGSVLPSQVDLPGCVKVALSPVEQNCISDNAYLPRIACPMLWLSPTNDFHAPIGNMAWNWRNFREDSTRFSISPHLNHRHDDAHAMTQYLWFEQHLCGKFVFPRTPVLEVQLAGKGGAPHVTVITGRTQAVRSVAIRYSTDAHDLTRFWRSPAVSKSDQGWEADCPVTSIDEPFFCYADVTYDLPEAYRNADQAPGNHPVDVFTISSRLRYFTSAALAAAGVKPTAKTERVIDDGSRGWADWYLINWDHPPLWRATTRKVKDPQWRGPAGAKLVFEVRPEADATLVVAVSTNAWHAVRVGAPEVDYSAVKLLNGSTEWQTVEVRLDEMESLDPKHPGALESWGEVTELSLSPSGDVLRGGKKEPVTGKPWLKNREIRNLHWE